MNALINGRSSVMTHDTTCDGLTQIVKKNFHKIKIAKMVALLNSTLFFTSDYTATSIGAGKTSTTSTGSSPKEPLVDMFLNPSKVEALNDEITALRTNFTKNLRQLDLDEVQNLSVDTVIP